MKNFKIFLLILASFAAYACVQNEEIPFDVKIEGDIIAAGPEGGVYKVKVNAPGNWTAMTGKPWITVSPANGRGPVECDVKVDSALFHEDRSGKVVIQLKTDEGTKEKTFDINQKGYPYSISIKEDKIVKNDSEGNPTVKIKNYDELENRKFEITVSANTEINVNFVKENGVQVGNEWITFEKGKIDLSSGLRPRNVKVKFNWETNSKEEARVAKILISPKDEEADESISQVLTIQQPGADPIESGTAKGDAQALIAISRSIKMYASTWDISNPLSQWENVTVWTEDDLETISALIENDPKYADRKDDSSFIEEKANSFIGRVRYVMFYIFATKESIPFEVKHLDAAEEISFYGNANSFLYSLTPGEHIATLTQLKRLSIVAYGLKGLDSHFLKLTNLEFLDLGSNNFQVIPAELTPENFPNLHSLNIGANQRTVIYDLSNTERKDYGGLQESVMDPIRESDQKTDYATRKGGFPEQLLKWETLDTLSLSVNYLWGEIPECEGNDSYGTPWPKYTAQDIADAQAATQKDTIGTYMVDLPKILPNAKCLRINLNRFYGNLPKWILYHPCLDLWIPDILVFNQEGTAPNGKQAKFDNVPLSLSDYSNLTHGYDAEGNSTDKPVSYYEFHKFKKKK